MNSVFKHQVIVQLPSSRKKLAFKIDYYLIHLYTDLSIRSFLKTVFRFAFFKVQQLFQLVSVDFVIKNFFEKLIRILEFNVNYLISCFVLIKIFLFFLSIEPILRIFLQTVYLQKI